MEKIGERNVLKHYFAVGALVPEVQQEEGLSHLQQAAELIAQAMIESDHGVKNPQHYMDAHRAWDGTTAEEKELFICHACKPTHIGIYVRCKPKAKKRLLEGLKAWAIVSRIFHAEVNGIPKKRTNWKDSDSVKPDAEQNPGDITIPVVVKRNYEVQRDSIIDGVCSVMTHLDGADRDAVWRDIEKRINKP